MRRNRLIGTLIVSSLAFCPTAGAASAPDPVILPSQSGPDHAIRAETIPVSNGAQLLVFFERLGDDGTGDARSSEIPLFAVLRDTLSDDNPVTDRLRQVWIFTTSSPSVPQRIAAGVPFFYHRSGLDSGSAARAPKAVLDMGDPARGAWRRVASAVVQTEIFDPFGAISRLTTRSYGANLGEYRATHISEIVNLINNHATDLTTALPAADIQDVSGRLDVSLRLLGGYVSDERLPAVFAKNVVEAAENRSHNWDVLRQAAEQNGLYFEPLHLVDAPDSFAMLWIAQPDAAKPGNHSFDARFLQIADPFGDGRIASWKGYSRIWSMDRDGVRVPDGTPGAKPVTMIPLAVYSLDYPGVPFPLIDFRDPGKPGRREMGLRLANDVTTGVLGLTTFGNLSYFAAKSGYMFVHKRHGGATDRMSRRSAFIELRHALGTDESLDPAFRSELMARLETLDLDPVEKSWSQECRAAWRQYDALMKYAADPRGLARLVEADRWREYRARHEGAAARLAGGLFHRTRQLTPEQMAQLKDQREADAIKRRSDQPASDPAAILAADNPAPARSNNTGGQ